jgi:hypothetical protein
VHLLNEPTTTALSNPECQKKHLKNQYLTNSNSWQLNMAFDMGKSFLHGFTVILQETRLATKDNRSSVKIQLISTSHNLLAATLL